MLEEVPAMLPVAVHDASRAGGALREGLAREAVLTEAREAAVDTMRYLAQHGVALLALPWVAVTAEACCVSRQGGRMDA